MYRETGTNQSDNIQDDELKGLIKSGFANVTLAQRRGESGYIEYQTLLSILPPIILEVVFDEAKKFEDEHDRYSKNLRLEIWQKHGKRWTNDSKQSLFEKNSGWIEDILKKPDESDFVKDQYIGTKNREILYYQKMRDFDRPNIMFMMNFISRECDKNGLWFKREEKQKV